MYESLLENVMRTLLAICNNKARVSGKGIKFQVKLLGKVSCINCTQLI